MSANSHGNQVKASCGGSCKGSLLHKCRHFAVKLVKQETRGEWEKDMQNEAEEPSYRSSEISPGIVAFADANTTEKYRD
ncbi:hypothetical protein Ciccas_002412 [Cichlidogyrus casuarinus]|uniref:Uncharacterized protein n=1 Tax=Cichlidogyrus casuarinus TaxID=1844966 RepID=A0ABD2QHJ0_9PLAT